MEYYNYASMKLLDRSKYINEEEEEDDYHYCKETDIRETIKKAREIKNCNYKESMDLYIKALKTLKKLKENNSRIYRNVLEFEIRPQEIANSMSLKNSLEKNMYMKKEGDKDYTGGPSNDNQTISINNKIASLYNEIADLCCIHDFIEKSLFYYDKACSYNPSKIDYIYKKGVLFQQMNDTERAINTFKIILSSEPNHIPTLFSLGNLYRYIDNHIALSYFEAILKIEPNNTEVLSLIASCYDNLGKLNEAISYQNKAVQIDPDNFNHKKFAQRLIEMKSHN
ncbi:tetratricopeptide repeat protein, putative [Plasmodium knowlesi strain H]|uniref:Tetratricopeptide repeat protein, putative n=3 Tax=Plasmodium knowlesi TaxID=5850 RepID=A0A5K1UEE0_PLAKH|nr:tetratricopeptide repeat protein, putative [Plasmodium knowlesi strain H]OTN64593.1 putative Tetratricopeptide repeat protein [Plasmodium knowlesi]CAA9989013.1 tetratricopeptide repeat protein, putative [Plasmodium knowlesi strain H]SBO24857.1 tetratricopeptide repeat protein, putative [Plasmodium knowlesi strain H]SBO27563.1 tetratricopeptide repeat protein, putative [Plasmodium knowlesi strain H]VVS78487.1 tetratricopeptide repeat protein, putative [Plasmodium knowlesi strain H]|eukprot:XP_002261361.1 hypothetical protein, conserved in Plasmodium species [Plasmodium knowlesi strain H]